MDSGFTLRWTIYNALAWAVGFSLYTPIGHGVTGNHGRELSLSQFLAHTVGLGVVSVLVLYAQKMALKKIANVSAIRMVVVTICFIVAFWAGYYQDVVDGPDTDILLGFLVLGCGCWIGSFQFSRTPIAHLTAILMFPIASILGEVCILLFFVLSGIEPDPHENIIHHSLFWIVVGSVTGLLGGLFTGKLIKYMSIHTPANQTQSA